MQARRRFWFKVAAGIILVGMLVFLVAAESVGSRFRAASASVFNILLHPFGRLAAISRTLKHPIQAIAENEELHRQLESISLDRAEFERLKTENAALRTALGLKEALRRPVIIAEISGEFNEGRDEYWLIDRGARDGISEGDVVVSPNGVLIGIVRTVAETAVTLRLLSSASESVAITIMPSGISAILRGDNNGEYVVSLVPEKSVVSVGDIVESGGKNENVPSGLPIGSVVNVEHRAAEAFQDIRVKTIAPLGSLDRVLVIRIH